MKEDIFMCFNDRQLAFVNLLLNIGIIHPIGAGGIRHPLTDKTELVFQKYRTNKYLNSVIQRVFGMLMGNDGRERMLRMQECGAIKKVTSENIAFLDIQIGQMTGLDLAKELKEIYPTLPVVFCTGYGQYALDAFKVHNEQRFCNT